MSPDRGRDMMSSFHHARDANTPLCRASCVSSELVSCLDTLASGPVYEVLNVLSCSVRYDPAMTP